MIDNTKIGKYLEQKILEKYKTKINFYKDYIKLKYNCDESSTYFDDYIKNETSRFNQIIHGKKSIQIHDLPIVASLLEMSMEEIISGEPVEHKPITKAEAYALNQKNVPCCTECNYQFKFYNEYSCPICGTTNPYMVKNNKVKILTDSEFKTLEQKYESDDLDNEVLAMTHFLHQKIDTSSGIGCYILAQTYQNNYFTGVFNVEKFLYWAEKGASLGDECCYNLLGEQYLEGSYGMKQDVEKAIFWFEKGMHQNRRCLMNLAKIYLTNPKYKNVKKAENLLWNIISFKAPDSLLYYSSSNTSLSFHLWDRDMDMTDDAYAKLGTIYYEEYKDYNKAFEYFLKAYNDKIDYNSSELNFYLGECYYLGRGTEIDYEKAVFHYSQKFTTDKSDLRLASCYLEGKGVPKDENKAMQMYDELTEDFERRFLTEHIDYIKQIKENINNLKS